MIALCGCATADIQDDSNPYAKYSTALGLSCFAGPESCAHTWAFVDQQIERERQDKLANDEASQLIRRLKERTRLLELKIERQKKELRKNHPNWPLD